jgi:hypothetical protein
MNYAELQQRVLDYAHRPDLVSQAASFVTLAEGLIRRDLQAATYRATLTDTDRAPGSGTYTLPPALDVVRALYTSDAKDGAAQVSLAELRRLSPSDPVLWFAVDAGTVELRGIPAVGATIDVAYFGHPLPLASPTDTNDLLTAHESLYVYGALFHLYQFTQDTELAQSALDTFSDALGKLNEAAGRKLGGARVAGAYHFGPIRRGY